MSRIKGAKNKPKSIAELEILLAEAKARGDAGENNSASVKQIESEIRTEKAGKNLN